MIPEVGPGCVRDAFFGHDDHIDGRCQQLFVPSEKLFDSSSDFVSLDGTADFLAGDDGHSRKRQAIGKIDQVEILASGAAALFVKIRKIFFLPNPLARTIAFTH